MLANVADAARHLVTLAGSAHAQLSREAPRAPADPAAPQAAAPGALPPPLLPPPLSPTLPQQQPLQQEPPPQTLPQLPPSLPPPPPPLSPPPPLPPSSPAQGSGAAESTAAGVASATASGEGASSARAAGDGGPLSALSSSPGGAADASQANALGPHSGAGGFSTASLSHVPVVYSPPSPVAAAEEHGVEGAAAALSPPPSHSPLPSPSFAAAASPRSVSEVLVDPYTGLSVARLGHGSLAEAAHAKPPEPGSAAAALQQLRAALFDAPGLAVVDAGFAAAVEAVCGDPAMRAALAAQAAPVATSDVHFFLRRAAAAARPDYVPSVEDVLKCRVRTTGILEETFDVDGAAFSVVDVGGQKNERRKWIHAFEGVSAIIFVVGVSEYDQVMFEDDKTNRLVDSLRLFEEMANHPLFANASLVLFFNKRDLFAEKIRRVDLRQPNPDRRAAETQPFLFDDYTGGCNEEAATKYIVNLFLSKRRPLPEAAAAPVRGGVPRAPRPRTQIPIFWRFTCALDSENFHVVLRAVKEAVFARALMVASNM